MASGGLTEIFGIQQIQLWYNPLPLSVGCTFYFLRVNWLQ